MGVLYGARPYHNWNDTQEPVDMGALVAEDVPQDAPLLIEPPRSEAVRKARQRGGDQNPARLSRGQSGSEPILPSTEEVAK